MSEPFDAIVIGAGAAGLMCALTAGQRGLKVLLLDHLDKAGAKILISGGGRCNFTNLALRTGPVHLGQPAFPQIGARPLHAARFHRADRAASHRLSREDARAVVLRRLRARRGRDAARRMRGGTCGRAARPPRHRRFPRRCISRRDRQRRLHRRIARAGDRRTVDPENGRDRLHLRHRAALRPARHRDVARPCAADGEPCGARHRRDAVRHLARRHRVVRRAKLPRKHPVHPSRPLGSRDPADLVLLAAGRHHRARSSAGARRRAHC